MIPVTQETKTALHQAVKQVRAQISWATSADTTETITSEDRLISMKKEAEGYYCKSTLRKITVVLTGTDINLLDRKITALVQVKTGANTWGDISWGSFTITEAQVDEAKGTSTFTGYGGIAMLQSKEYSTGELSFPTTVGGLLKQVADKFALTIDPSVVILPEEYQKVEYLQATTTQWFDTGLTPTDVDEMEADLTLDDRINATYATFLGGSYQQISTEGSKIYSFLTTHSSSETDPMMIGFGFTTTSGGATWTFTNTAWNFGERKKIHTVLKSNETKMTVDGQQVYYSTATRQAPTTGTTVPLLTYQYRDNRLRDYGWNGKIYSLTLSKNGTKVRDFVPCRRKSDNTPGLYDRVTGAFYTNAGTGDFTTGSDDTSLPNLDAPIPEDLWEKISGTTYRDILEEIAGATGTIAVIGRGDDILNLELPPVSAASETLTEDNLITAKIGENWGKVSAVVLSRQPQNDNVEVVDEETAALPTGKNMFSGWIMGESLDPSTGAETIRTAGANTGFIPVDFGKNPSYEISGLAGDLFKFIAAYNIDKQFAGRTSAGDYTSLTLTSNSFRSGSPTATGEIKYIRVATYEHPSVQGTIDEVQGLQTQLEVGAATTAYEPYIPNGRVDFVIANNEIMDKQRETTAQPILDAVKGWDYRNAEIKTEGHGYHEIGDRLDLTVAGETYPVVVTKSSITIDGGIKEVLTSATPEVIPIDYAKSGGITKTVFRTELTVDKQAQQIDSIVSRQDATDAAVAEQFTQITQNITQIVATAQASGGGNFIRNSVGFGKESDGTLTVWTYGSGATTTTVKSQSAPASLSAGAVSGHEIQMTGASAISQQVSLTPGETYTLALRAKKNTTGAVTVKVANTSNNATVTLASGTSYNWQLQKVEFVPVASTNTVTITVPSGASVEITDLILTSGGAYTWRQASGEIYNAQVSLDQAGVQVRSSVYTGDYVEITPLEFSGWSNASGTMKKVFTLNRETTEVEQLEARSQLKMAPIKIVPINNSSYKGWAFVKEA